MKKYAFHFSKLILTLLYFGIALCIACLLYNVFRFIQTPPISAYEWLSYIIVFFTSVFFFVVVLSMLIRSQYIITDKDLIIQFGIIKSRYDISSIRSLHLFQGKKKLAVYFNDEKYMIIVVKETWNDDLIRTLTERNDKIVFSFSTAEEEEELTKKK